MKVLMIGLDGASWNFLDPFIEKGSLPNLKEFKEKGLWGNLNSVMPPVTIPSWISFAKGKTPKAMRLYDWFELDREERKMVFYSSSSARLRGENFWDILGGKGLRTGVINLPGTYPPQRQQNGFLVTGVLTPQNHGFTDPEALEGILREKYGYRVHPVSEGDYLLEDVKQLIRTRFQIARDFFQEADFLNLTIQKNDEIQHRYYGCPEVEDLWKTIDEELGRLVEINTSGITVLVSDHGFQESKYFFYFNNWLIEKRYLILDNRALRLGEALQKGKYRRMRRAAHMLGIKDIVKKLIFRKPPDDFRKIIPGKDGSYDCTKLIHNMDWDRTRAFIINSVVYVKDRVVAHKLINDLRRIENPFSGEKLFSGAKQEIELLEDENRIVIHTETHGMGIRTRYGNGIIWSDKPTWRGIHKKQGIYVFFGNEYVSQSGRYADLNLIDIAPTILNLYGIPAPHDMEGKTVVEIFNFDDRPNQVIQQSETFSEDFFRDEDKVFSLEEEENIAERLGDLGYL